MPSRSRYDVDYAYEDISSEEEEYYAAMDLGEEQPVEEPSKKPKTQNRAKQDQIVKIVLKGCRLFHKALKEHPNQTIGQWVLHDPDFKAILHA